MNIMNDNTILLLNFDYLPLSTINWKKALKLLTSGKAEAVGNLQFNLKSKIQTITKSITIPKILRLVYVVTRLRKTRLVYSRKNIFLRDNYKCGYCGEQMNSKSKKLTADHILPKSRGGANRYENLVTCCKECNRKKGDKTPEEAKMKLLISPRHPTVLEFINMRFVNAGVYELLQNITQ